MGSNEVGLFAARLSSMSTMLTFSTLCEPQPKARRRLKTPQPRENGGNPGKLLAGADWHVPCCCCALDAPRIFRKHRHRRKDNAGEHSRYSRQRLAKLSPA